MNLHISAPSVFIDRFHKNLEKLGLTSNNKIILRSIKGGQTFPSAKMNSAAFQKLVGDTKQYERVFIHQFSPLLYPWVAQNEFNQLNWMIWGADLYNLPEFENQFFEPITRSMVRSWNVSDMLYRLKVQFTASRFHDTAYRKVDRILTWMNGEFSFAKAKLPVSNATHEFFFYENPVSFHELSMAQPQAAHDRLPVYILGNSGSPTNNHLDVLDYLQQLSIRAKLILPVSYGDAWYVLKLKRKASLYTHGQVEFLDRFMSFDEYLNFLRSTDGLIMNTLRPQGYGNILMMMCLGKPVYMNAGNISLQDLDANQIRYNTLQDLPRTEKPQASSVQAIENLFAQEKLISSYRRLFS